ncbi:glycoside hydrolase [Marinilongibacter aquaticus]|uniref:glycosyl hydrolase family 18 protein n=1 Tax=Marinilongibacter aquaticus TaxID=2975157 RepID=UPI0021BD3801|nr:glycosyl hydrolase family 18 protein [Marinilongibacter aquaticus]UBM60478.1 glycoside hydrolase [Marinilongibacter aquaticus]
MRKIVFLFSFLLTTMAWAQSKDFKVIAYCNPNLPISEIPFDLVTHINYSFAIPAKTGDTLLPLRDDTFLKELVPAAHAKNVKVFISIGGWGIGDGGGNDTRFHEMADSEEGRQSFIASTMRFVKKYGLDGVDLDWEYPDPDNRSADDYVALCRVLSGKLHAQGKQLTAAVVHSGEQANGIKEEVYPYMDWLNIMAYDGDYGPKEILHHSPYSMALHCIDFWINEKHLPAEKCILGLPFYAKRGHGKYGYGYKKLLEVGASPYDDYWQGHFYNGVFTIANKTKLAQEKGCGGVMIWEMALDSPGEFSLFKTIHDNIK